MSNSANWKLDPKTHCRCHGTPVCEPMPLTGTTCIECHKEFVQSIQCTCHDLVCPNAGVVLSDAAELHLCCYVSARLYSNVPKDFFNPDPMSDKEIEDALSRYFGIHGGSCGPGVPYIWHKGNGRPVFCYEPLRIDLTVRLEGKKLIDAARSLCKIPRAGAYQLGLFGAVRGEDYAA